MNPTTNNNNNKGIVMGNIDLVAALKYLWAILFPIFLKAWSMVDKRIEKTEKAVEQTQRDMIEMKQDISVLKAQNEHMIKTVQNLNDSIKQLTQYLLENK